MGTGLNYGHGTGHGVGFCLNVHEGPISISPGEGADPKQLLKPEWLFQMNLQYTGKESMGSELKILFSAMKMKRLNSGSS